MYAKLVPETEHIIFHIKIYLQSFLCIYHFYHLFEIIYESIFTTRTSHRTTGSSVKPSISGVTM